MLLTFVDERELGFMLGAADYLTKPVQRAQVTDLLARYPGRPPS